MFLKEEELQITSGKSAAVIGHHLFRQGTARQARGISVTT
jgi:hypothetical protein